MVVGAGDPSILLKRQNVKAFGRKRQLDLDVDLFGEVPASSADIFPGAASVSHS